MDKLIILIMLLFVDSFFIKEFIKFIKIRKIKRINFLDLLILFSEIATCLKGTYTYLKIIQWI